MLMPDKLISPSSLVFHTQILKFNHKIIHKKQDENNIYVRQRFDSNSVLTRLRDEFLERGGKSYVRINLEDVLEDIKIIQS